MNPESLLILGCFGLGLVIAYAWWSAVRVTVLKADLQEIVSDLDIAMMAKGMADNVEYLAHRKFMINMIGFSPYMTVFYLTVCLKVLGEDSAYVTGYIHRWYAEVALALRGTLPQEAEEVGKAWSKFLLRLLIHFVFSPANMLILIGMYVSGRTEGLASKIAILWRDPGAVERLTSAHP